jgi:hypothetical protein
MGGPSSPKTCADLAFRGAGATRDERPNADGIFLQEGVKGIIRGRRKKAPRVERGASCLLPQAPGARGTWRRRESNPLSILMQVASSIVVA